MSWLSKLAGSLGPPGKCSSLSSALPDELRKAMQLHYSSQNALAWGPGARGGHEASALSLCHCMNGQVWSSHSARLGALHVCTSTVSSHSLQRTAQHQWNLHSHLVMRVTRVVS